MKVYITKYALTKGILEEEGEHSSNFPSMVAVRKYSYYHKPDWHLTKEEAIHRAKEMKAKKLNSLKKQLNRIENLTFK